VAVPRSMVLILPNNRNVLSFSATNKFLLYQFKCFYVSRHILVQYIKIAFLLCYFLGWFVVDVFPAIYSLLTDSLSCNLRHWWEVLLTEIRDLYTDGDTCLPPSIFYTSTKYKDSPLKLQVLQSLTLLAIHRKLPLRSAKCQLFLSNLRFFWPCIIV
jgi:hypothetical protein